MQDIEPTPLPKGFRNVRVFDQRDHKLLASLWCLGAGGDRTEIGKNFSVVTEQITASSIIIEMLSLMLEEVTSWRSTRALASSERGQLDLMVDIDTRPREYILGDMRMPDQLIAYIRRNAPKR
jgi:hypothetical protein